MPSKATGARRLATLVGHVVAPSEQSRDAPQLEVVPSSSALVSMAPLLAVGAYQWYQSRQQADKDANVELTDTELRAEELGFDALRLRLLAPWAQQMIDAKQLPGLVVAIARNEQVVFSEAYGSGYSKDSILEVEEMVRPLIAATCLSLVDEGHLKLDEGVESVLPYFAKCCVHKSGSHMGAFETVPMERSITLRHLLTDTAGFASTLPTSSGAAATRALDALLCGANPVIGCDADFERLVEIPLVAQPGTQYRQSLGIWIVAHVIEKVCKQPLREVVEQRFLRPLDMMDTGWSAAKDKQARLAPCSHASPWLTHRLWGHRLTGDYSGHTSWLGWVAHPRPSEAAELPETISRKSRFYSTAVDQICFHHMLLRGGCAPSGQRLLSADSVSALTRDQLPSLGASSGLGAGSFNSHAADKGSSAGAAKAEVGVGATGQGLSLGMHVVTRPSAARLAGSRGAFSSSGLLGTECWSDPSMGLTVFVGTQLLPGWALPNVRQEVAGRVYGALVPSSAAKFVQTGVEESGGMMGQLMNSLIMMSMFSGGLGGGIPGMQQPQPGAAAGAAGGAAGGGGGVLIEEL
eukprot:TRINITY_DN29931_c0_g1_i1.p1 TRINITY_DN29931_c0_g1~~TRINITY_DN29931_c0_g1_i1.p1  ORF type:complete len:610 (-),score=82.13 TRINITY_DN29931_c0_g1_i1:276-2009(-)